MKVDRSKFLLVVGAISAATGVGLASTSCSSSSSTSKNDAGSSSGTDSGGDDDSGGGSVNNDAGDAGNNACLGDLPDASTSGDAGDAGDAATGCAALTGPGCSTACDDAELRFKSAIAEDIRVCLMPAPACEGTTHAADCIKASAAKACPDSTATSTCKDLVAGCTDDSGVDSGVVFDQATCEKLVRPLSESGRQSFVTCVTEGIAGNCSSALSFCIDSAWQ